MRARINLATDPFVNYRPFVGTVGLLTAATLGLTLLLVVESIQTWRERTHTQQRLRELTRQRAELTAEQQQLETELRAPATQERLERVRFLNQLILQKSLSWTQLFLDLQKRLPSQVRVLSLSPSWREDGNIEVKVRVGGRSAPAVVEFLRALEQGGEFQEFELYSQRRPSGRSADAVVAEVGAVYVQE